MISYVNEHLFDNEILSEDNTWDNGERYAREAIKTSSMMTRKDKETGEVRPSQKTLAMWNRGDSDSNTRIISTIGGPYNAVRVNIKTSKNVKYDSDIFCIAIPFAGYVLPMDEAEDLDIFKAAIVQSEEYFDHIDGNRYRKAVYAIVRPNYHAANQDTMEYEHSADFVIRFAQSNKTRKGQDTTNAKWKIRTVCVHFKADGDFELSESVEEVPYDAFDPESTKDVTLFPTVPPIDPSVPRPEKPAGRNNGGNGNRNRRKCSN